MKLQQLLQLIGDMRTAQRNRSPTAADLEQQVDNIVQRGLNYYKHLDNLEQTASEFEKYGFERIEI